MLLIQIQVRKGLGDAILLIPLDGSFDPFLQRGGHCPIKILIGFAGVEQDGERIVWITGADFDILFKMDAQGSDCGVKQFFDRKVSTG